MEADEAKVVRSFAAATDSSFSRRYEMDAKITQNVPSLRCPNAFEHCRHPERARREKKNYYDCTDQRHRKA